MSEKQQEISFVRMGWNPRSRNDISRMASLRHMQSVGILQQESLRDVRATIEKIRALPSRAAGATEGQKIGESTVREKVNQVSLYLKAYGDELGFPQELRKMYNRSSKDMQIELERPRVNGALSSKELANFTEEDAIVAFFNEMYQTHAHLLQKDPAELTKSELSRATDLLIVACNILIPSVRGAFASVKYKNADIAKDNFLLLDSGHIVWNQFKTRDAYGQLVVKIQNDQLLDMLRAYVKLLPESNQGYLFASSRGIPFALLDESAYTTRVRAIFHEGTGKALGVRHLRIFLTSHLLKGGMSLQEMQTLAAQRHQSIKQITLYTRKPPPPAETV